MAREGPASCQVTGAAPAFRTEGAVLRYVLKIVFLPALVLAQGSPQVPNGVDLLQLPLREFQAYVSGIYEVQVPLSEAMGAPQASCVDSSMNTNRLGKHGPLLLVAPVEKDPDAAGWRGRVPGADRAGAVPGGRVGIGGEVSNGLA